MHHGSYIFVSVCVCVCEGVREMWKFDSILGTVYLRYTYTIYELYTWKCSSNDMPFSFYSVHKAALTYVYYIICIYLWLSGKRMEMKMYKHVYGIQYTYIHKWHAQRKYMTYTRIHTCNPFDFTQTSIEYRHISMHTIHHHSHLRTVL